VAWFPKSQPGSISGISERFLNPVKPRSLVAPDAQRPMTLVNPNVVRPFTQRGHWPRLYRGFAGDVAARGSFGVGTPFGGTTLRDLKSHTLIASRMACHIRVVALKSFAASTALIVCPG